MNESHANMHGENSVPRIGLDVIIYNMVTAECMHVFGRII